jgi:two-component system sensor histidine kinase KdpD
VTILERADGADGADGVDGVAPDGPGERWRVAACVGEPPCHRLADADVDVEVDPDVHLVARGGALTAPERAVLEAASGQALLALRQQRAAAQAAAQKRRADATELRTALLSAVGHDLRTPLTSIKAAIGSLRDPELTLSPQDSAELLDTIEVSADRLTGLIGNLLDSSRLATGAVSPLLRPVGYDEIVARALSGLDQPTRAVVRVDVDEDLPRVLADVGLTERVVANLVDNAVRHGARPGALPDVTVQASAHADRVELRVYDHGPGLPRGAAEAVFAPFARLDSSPSSDRDRVPGVGLGLSVAKGFVEAMAGTITAEDTPGGGLTVVVSLPIATAATALVPATRPA